MWKGMVQTDQFYVEREMLMEGVHFQTQVFCILKRHGSQKKEDGIAYSFCKTLVENIILACSVLALYLVTQMIVFFSSSVKRRVILVSCRPLSSKQSHTTVGIIAFYISIIFPGHLN